MTLNNILKIRSQTRIRFKDGVSPEEASLLSDNLGDDDDDDNEHDNGDNGNGNVEERKFIKVTYKLISSFNYQDKSSIRFVVLS